MSELEQPRRWRAGDADRDAVLEVLQRAHAAGRLSVEELGERQDHALRARYTDELPALVNDLPEGRSWVAPSVPAAANPQARTPSAPVPHGVEPEWTATIMSGSTVELQPGSAGLRNVAWWGGDEIYVRDAMGPGSVVTLELHAIMAGHTIHVPPGVRVVDEPIAIMGGNDIDAEAQGDGSNGTVILRGLVFWGGHEVKPDRRDPDNGPDS